MEKEINYILPKCKKFLVVEQGNMQGFIISTVEMIDINKLSKTSILRSDFFKFNIEADNNIIFETIEEATEYLKNRYKND